MAVIETVRQSKPALPDAAEKAHIVEAMFDRIAPRYDLMNRLLTLRLDQRWRRHAIRLAGVRPGELVVDLACGTGDLCALAAATGARVVGVDFAAGMLAGARRRKVRAQLVRADALRLPISSGSCDVVTCAFGLRNFVSIPDAVGEVVRILKPGGRVALLEVDDPSGRWLRWGHALYFRRLVPAVGALLSDRWAYAYLPQSTAYLPAADELQALLRSAGLRGVTKHRLSRGVAQLIVAER